MSTNSPAVFSTLELIKRNHGYLDADPRTGLPDRTLDARDFATDDGYEQYKAERARERARQEQDAQAKAEEQARIDEAIARQRKTPLERAFVVNAKSLDDFPQVKAALAAVKAANVTFNKTADAADKAQARVSATEDAAARGQRDDAALSRTRTDLEHALADQRIAGLAIEHAEAAVARARDEVRADVYVHLSTLHADDIRQLHAALAVAAEHSNRATDLEKASSRLLIGPSDPRARRPIVRPLMPASWKREFNPKKGYFKFWVQVYRKFGYLD
jgi:hypothetical protein